MVNVSLLFIMITTFLFFCSNEIYAVVDTITQSQSISDGKTLVSKDGSFEMGFFNPGISKNRYLGIWYKRIPGKTVVWVANRRVPITGSSGLLKISNTGNLILLSQNKNIVWSTNSSEQTQITSPILQLLDSGNLVLKDGKNYLWQSFDYPCDTLLAGMKLGWDLRTGLDRRITAWKNVNDPSPGGLSWGVELHGWPEPVMWNGSKKYVRTGPWNGIRFSSQLTKAIPLFKFTVVSNENEVYLTFHLVNKSLYGRQVLNETAYVREFVIWDEAIQTWTLPLAVPRDQCDYYNHCGAHGYCDLSSKPVCKCFDKFIPKSPGKWNSNDWSGGCARHKPLNCQKDGFVKFGGLKLPDTTHTWANISMNLKECKTHCLKNCSCMAYANTDVRNGGSGCVIWVGDLIDSKLNPGGGQDIFIRVLASELEANDELWKIGMIVASAVCIILGMLLVAYYIKKRRKSKDKIVEGRDNQDEKEDLDFPSYELSTIASATNNFSIDKKLGEGGFGPVYKGILADGQQIAVKRLSRSSGQGLNEFKNEVVLIAKLQHRNLVRLLGCCIEGEEKLLVYEYMPNKSLDFFIFDDTQNKFIDWPKRFHIICGIARGLLYLHQDSRLRIIHRDLKASNVLLDSDMNPKISDFGLARICGGDQTEGNTNRVVGTYGYMAPEYAIDGQFSIKSDVFSFGILLLEIISGKKNKGFYHMNHDLNLIGHAWNLWKEDKAVELINEDIQSSCDVTDVLRCIHISLLCAQQQPEDRPAMTTVVQMLGSKSSLPEPTQPGFSIGKKSYDDCTSATHELHSSNDVTITLLEPR